MRQLSGGMKRRVLVAQALVHRPPVIVLDEPTAGVDVELRQTLWQFIARLNKEGHTVLLTTHYLEEADHLADQLVIVDHGRVVVRGTPEALKRGLSGDAVAVELAERRDVDDAARVLDALPGVRELTRTSGVLRARVDDGAVALPEVMAALDAASLRLAAVTVARPSLDDVYLRYAGRAFGSADGTESAGRRTAGSEEVAA
jgi:ABC-2 type transport system ATP-binding protein